MSEEKNDIIETAKTQRHIYLVEKINIGKALSAGELRELKLYEGHETKEGQVSALADVAKSFKVGARTVDRWVVEGMPRRTDGNYDLLEIQAWKFNKENSGKETTQRKIYEEELLKYKSLLAQLNYKKLTGEVVPVTDVDAGRVQRILIIKKALLGLPGRVAPQLVGLSMEEIKNRLTIRINEIITEFAKG